MVQALEAIVYALAPAFAAGFAIQKLLEILDAFFSWLAAFIAKKLDARTDEKLNEKLNKLKEPNKEKAKPSGILGGKLTSNKITKAMVVDLAETNTTTSRGNEEPKVNTSDGSTKKIEEKKVEANSDSTKKVEEEKKEFVKSIKVLLTGIAAIIIASWIVLNSSISVIDPLITLMNNNTNMSTNLTANISISTTAGANKAFYVSSFIDDCITVFFIAAGTDGVNSILKYLGYAKEEKKETVSADAE